MKHIFKPKGVCSSKIQFELDGNIVKNVKFEDGCDGNLQGISALSEGQPAKELIEKLAHIKCGRKNTSCPAQFTIALQEALNIKKEATLNE